MFKFSLKKAEAPKVQNECLNADLTLLLYVRSILIRVCTVSLTILRNFEVYWLVNCFFERYYYNFLRNICSKAYYSQGIQPDYFLKEYLLSGAQRHNVSFCENDIKSYAYSVY